MCSTTIEREKHYVQMPKYIIIQEESTPAPILHSYDYIKYNQLQMPAHSHHALLQTRTISHTNTFSRQPICQGIQFRSLYNTS